MWATYVGWATSNGMLTFDLALPSVNKQFSATQETSNNVKTQENFSRGSADDRCNAFFP
jgi:hypothetical protein